MLIFAMDTCCKAATAAVVSDEPVLAQVVLNNNMQHSQRLMPLVEQMFADLGLTPADIDVFATAVGPGSFTGVRIGVSSVKALAHAADKPCVAVSTLEGLAANVPYFEGLVCPILDARREQVYTAVFRDGRRVRDDCAMPVGELAASFAGDHPALSGTPPRRGMEDVLFLGDGVFPYRGVIEGVLGERARFAPPHLNMNLASSVAAVALEKARRGLCVGYDELAPNYVRLSQVGV